MTDAKCQKISYILDLRSEKLYREAEDELFFVYDIDAAKANLQKAIEYSPQFVKAIVMLANIAVIEGDLKRAVILYKQAEWFDPANVKACAGLANIYEMVGRLNSALNYANKALKITPDSSSVLKRSLIELTSSILIGLKRYDEAQRLFKSEKFMLSTPELMNLHAENMSVIKQKLDAKKRIKELSLRVLK